MGKENFDLYNLLCFFSFSIMTRTGTKTNVWKVTEKRGPWSQLNALPSGALFWKTKEVIYQTKYLYGDSTSIWAFISMSVQMGLEATIQFYDSYWMICIFCNYSSPHALWLSLSCKCVRGKCANIAVTVKLAHGIDKSWRKVYELFSIWLLWIC